MGFVLKKTNVVYLFFMVVLFHVPPAFGDPGPGNDADTGLRLESVIVTADKREQNIQEVPASISSFSEMDIDDADVKEVPRIIDRVPNLSLSSQNQGVTYVNSRGLSPSMLNRKNPFVLYMDGVPSSDITCFNADFNNVERVEVLRGPQGTLYGKNAMGGVLNVITKAPSNEVSGKIGMEIGENETYGIKGFINSPLKRDKLFLGLSGSHFQTRGFMKNDDPEEEYYDDRDIYKIRGKLRWLPSDRLEVVFSSGADVRKGGDGPMIGTSELTYHALKNPTDRVNTDAYDTALRMHCRLDAFDIYSISTLARTSEDYYVDYSYGSTRALHGIVDSDTTNFSQEFRIHSPDTREGLSWIGGIYYEYFKKDDNELAMEYNTSPMLGYNYKSNWPTRSDSNTVAVFGQTTFPLIGKLNLTFGLRYEKVFKEMEYKRLTTRLDNGAPVPPMPGVPSRAAYSIDSDWDALTPKVVLDYRFNSNLMTYASVAQGYLEGGFNNCIDDPSKTKFDEQTSINYEVGVKSSWLDNRFICNAAVFYMDIDDMQVGEYPAMGVFVASNAGKAHSCGVEIETRFRPVKGFDLYGSFGLIRGEYDEYMGFGNTDYAGNKLKATPEYTINVGAQYRHRTGVFARADVFGYGETWFNESNSDESRQGSYGIVNAKVGYETEHWDCYLYGDNLFDKEYFDSIFTSMIRNSYMVGEPRKIGVNISYRW
ncbi:MAG: TonB-dependent receptor [Desulfobacteraceae bacterium]|nr:TonB-dependent receptor [Desulfobacteraceae bacterium]